MSYELGFIVNFKIVELPNYRIAESLNLIYLVGLSFFS